MLKDKVACNLDKASFSSFGIINVSDWQTSLTAILNHSLTTTSYYPVHLNLTSRHFMWSPEYNEIQSIMLIIYLLNETWTCSGSGILPKTRFISATLIEHADPYLIIVRTFLGF